MFVSKNGLPGIRVFPVKDKSRRQWTPKFAQPGKRALGVWGAAHFKSLIAYNPNFDLIAFFKTQCINDPGGKPHGQTVSPFRDLHSPLMICVVNRISFRPVSAKTVVASDVVRRHHCAPLLLLL